MYPTSIDASIRTPTRAVANALGMLLLLVALGGCATHKDKLLPHDSATMLEIWNQSTGGQSSNAESARELLDARQALRRPLTADSVLASRVASLSYTRTAQNEINRQFHRLPNPDLVMYVFPHLAGTLRVPVPGYSTVFPLYERVWYAMPGERTEDY